jgi:hypothetical protein
MALVVTDGDKGHDTLTDAGDQEQHDTPGAVGGENA